MSKKRILIVDDEQNIRRILQASFDKNGWVGIVAESGDHALNILKDEEIDCVLTDVTMPGMSGYDLQKTLSGSHPDLPVIIMTAYGTIPQAIEAIRNGAFEYIPKPFDLDSVKKIVAAALSGSGKEVKTPGKGKKPAAKKSGGPAFIAESPQMKEIYATLQQVADSRATVLITGESGTGKE
ncbi:MAG: sigma-54-dependent Fis family transcriptional regulator, partial [Armatimonadetes bacterium]|nr:sigma-54-dependent Fis family transcriptional regulator [Armatimonadota bacterium]